MPSMKDKRRSSRLRYTKGGYPKPKGERLTLA